MGGRELAFWGSFSVTFLLVSLVSALIRLAFGALAVSRSRSCCIFLLGLVLVCSHRLGILAVRFQELGLEIQAAQGSSL